MKKPALVTFLALVLSLSVACASQSPAPRDANAGAVEAAYRYLDSLGNRYGLVAPREQLAVLDVDRDMLGQTHVRFQQVHHDVPVFGSHLVAHLDSNLNGRAVTGDLLRVPGDIAYKPVLDTSQAREIASSESCATETGSPELVFYSGKETLRLAYQVPGRKGMKTCDVLVAADEPRVLGVINRSPTSSTREQE